MGVDGKARRTTDGHGQNLCGKRYTWSKSPKMSSLFHRGVLIVVLLLTIQRSVAQAEEKVTFEYSNQSAQFSGYVMAGSKYIGKIPCSEKVFSPSTNVFHAFSPDFLTEELTYKNFVGNVCKVTPRVFADEFKADRIAKISNVSLSTAFGNLIFGYDQGVVDRACNNFVSSTLTSRMVDSDANVGYLVKGTFNSEYRATKDPYIEKSNFAIVVMVTWSITDVAGNVLATKTCSGGYYFGMTTVKKREQQEQYTRQQAIVESLKNFLVDTEVLKVLAVL